MELSTVAGGRRSGYEAVGQRAATDANPPSSNWEARWSRKTIFIGACVVLGGALAALSFASTWQNSANEHPLVGSPQDTSEDEKMQEFDSEGRFIMKDYDAKKPWASFLPGVGGEWGLPMWAFYVNRGQAMAAFGVENKDKPLLTFRPANEVYQTTAQQGFRTVLKVKREHKAAELHQPFFEPFTDGVERNMFIGMNELEITELDTTSEITTSVMYFTVPDEDFPALVRRVTFKNEASTSVELEIIDGVAKLEPFGVNSGQLAAMGRTLEGWMRVYNCAGSKKKCTKPYFKLSASTADSAQVQMVTEGNFVLSFMEGEDELLPIVVDPTVVFGEDTTLRVPKGFDSVPKMLERSQLKASVTPSAFAAKKIKLAPGASATLVSCYGHAKTVDQLEHAIVPTVLAPGFVPTKYTAAVALTKRLTETVQSSTANPLFDAFSRQMMLDNLLRGGYPEELGDGKTYHTFSRIHGDLERDYNNFQIDATYYSQGSGNYRDVNQNRRVDVYLFPAIRDFNIRQFLTLKQADGYNPLTVATAFFVLEGGAEAAKTLAASATQDDKSKKALAGLLQRPYRPGQLFVDAAAAKVKFTVEPEGFLDSVATASRQVFAANYTHEGFWADHWTYDLDQIISFEAIYPDDVETVMWDAEKLPFYMSSGTVQPRDFKYVEVEEGKIRQYNSVYDDPMKLGQLADRNTKPDGAFELAVGADGSLDEESTTVYTVQPIAKVLLLCVTKFALLDPSGMGIEMDANKPGWNDAMNGLPGLLGSGMPETCETLRIVRWLLKTFKAVQRPVVVPVELSNLMQNISLALADSSLSDFAYWDAVADAREAYRASVRLFFSGTEATLTSESVIEFLEPVETKLEKAIEKAITKYSPDGIIMPTYFAHKVTDYEYTGFKSFVGQPFVKAKAMEPQVFPLFLEGPVRQLKTVKKDDTDQFVAIAEAVKASALYDKPIGQYKICESLEGQPFEMGRMMAFTPGWLENESIWLHMSFKYYLELLRAGLFEAYWEAMETGAPYNMDPEIYGRSPLECASFIVSSAFPDKKLWGSGFLARLSGSTAEFLSMWLLIFAGPQPFILTDDGSLELALRPAIPADLFKDDGTASFNFLGAVEVTYHNPSGIDTWTAEPVKIMLTQNGDSEPTFSIHGSNVPAPHAAAVRDFKYDAIDIYFA